MLVMPQARELRPAGVQRNSDYCWNRYFSIIYYNTFLYSNRKFINAGKNREETE